MTDPIVTVVIPTRNRRELLHRALRSVLEQTISGVEIVVVDDGSESDLGLAEAGFANKVIVVRNSNTVGAQQSRLIGARTARAAHVALLDSDDWWRRDKLEKQLEVVSSYGDALISCRLTVSNGTLSIDAPWRSLKRGERVEDFVYARRGMLQSSTILAQRATLITMLEQTSAYRVHNDTTLFLEAQKRGLEIIQMPEALVYFDNNPRPDRISYDVQRVTASMSWFNEVSPGWSVEARKGFILTDLVTRYVNVGQRGKAIACLLRAYHPALSRLYAMKIAYILCNGSPRRFF